MDTKTLENGLNLLSHRSPGDMEYWDGGDTPPEHCIDGHDVDAGHFFLPEPGRHGDGGNAIYSKEDAKTIVYLWNNAESLLKAAKAAGKEDALRNAGRHMRFYLQQNLDYHSDSDAAEDWQEALDEWDEANRDAG